MNFNINYKYFLGPPGMIGVTTNNRSVSIWANSHYLCSEVLTELSDLGNKQQLNDNMNKEENLGRITSDPEGWQKIRITLGKCIHPLQVDSYASYVFINIYTGEESDQPVNVNKVVELGAKQTIEFQDDLPGAFGKPLTTKVVLMTSAKDKQAKRKVNRNEYNTDLSLAHTFLFLGTNQLRVGPSIQL